MKRIFSRIFLSLACLCLLSACTGAGEGDGGLTPTPPVPVFGDFILGVATSQPGVGNALRAMARDFQGKALGFAGGGIEVSETRNTVSDISFERDGAVEVEVDFPGVFVVELVRQGAPVNQEFPDFGVTRIPFGDYNRFEMKFQALESQDIPPELLSDPLVTTLLLDRTFVVEGRFREAEGKDVNGDGNIDTVPFRILSDNEVEIRVSSPNFFTVSADKLNFFFIAFQIDSWFEGLLPQFQDLAPSDLSGGVAVVSKEVGSERIATLLQDFETNVEVSCKSAPSEDEAFEEDDVDEESGSEPL